MKQRLAAYKKSRLSKHRKLLSVIIVLVFIILVGTGYVYIAKHQTKHLVTTHGPKIGDAARTSRAVSGVNTTKVPKTPPSSKVSTPVPAASASNNLGIAAGGGLVSLPQPVLLQYLSEVKALGATWVRWDVNWSGIQANGQNYFDWEDTDRVANAVAANNLHSLIVITGTPGWARQSACNDDEFCAPNDPNTFASFASIAVNRFKTKGIHYWEIWNEPNFAWLPSANAVSYSGLLKATYPKIKHADSSAVVLVGGLAAAADADGDISPITFMKQLYSNGTRGSFDAVATHPYSYPVIASYQAWWNFWQQQSTIRQIMVSAGDGNKKIWPTEYGAPTNGPGAVHTVTQLAFTYPDDFMSETSQKQMADDVIVQYKKNAAWLGPFFWYSLVDNGTGRDTTENFFGLLRYDHSHKPAYDSIRTSKL